MAVSRLQLAMRQAAEVARIERAGMAELQKFIVQIRLRAQAQGRFFNIQPNELPQLRTAMRDNLMAVHILGVKRVGLETGVKRPGTISASTLSEVLSKYRGMTKWELDELEVMYDAQTVDVLRNLTVRLNKGVRDALQESIESGLTPSVAINRYFSKLGVNDSNAYFYTTLFRTQLQLAYQTAQYTEYQEPHIDEIVWGYEYITVGDDRVRESHQALSGTKMPKNSSFWQTHWPPNGYNCRCSVLPIMTDDEDAKTKRPPKWAQPDAGFAFNPAELTGFSAPTEKVSNARVEAQVVDARALTRTADDVRKKYPHLDEATLRKKYPKIWKAEDEARKKTPVVGPAPTVPVAPKPPIAPPSGVRKGSDRLPSDLRAKYPELSDAELRKKFPKIMAKDKGSVLPLPVQRTSIPAGAVPATVPKHIEHVGHYDPTNKYHSFGEKLRQDHGERLTHHEKAVEVGKKIRGFVDEQMRAGVLDKHAEIIDELKAQRDAYERVLDKSKADWRRDPKLLELNDKLQRARDGSATLRAEYVKKAVAATRSMGVQPNKIGTAQVSPKHVSAVQEAKSQVPSGWIKRDVKIKSGSNGWFNAATGTAQISGYSAREAASCAIHELMHVAQYSNPAIAKLEKEYHDKRTKGESLKPIRGGNVGAIGYEDEWVHHYMGRLYKGQEHIKEILTMCSEEVMIGYDHGLYLNDKETYDFVLGLIALGG